MKKKHRDITVNGIKYIWKVKCNCDGDGGRFLFIPGICSYRKVPNNIRHITPKYVSEIILKEKELLFKDEVL